MKTYRISLSGCDDSTTVLADLTAGQAAVFERVAAMTAEKSSYGCMPVMYVTPATAADRAEENADD